MIRNKMILESLKRKYIGKIVKINNHKNSLNKTPIGELVDIMPFSWNKISFRKQIRTFFICVLIDDKFFYFPTTIITQVNKLLYSYDTCVSKYDLLKYKINRLNNKIKKLMENK